MKWMLRAVLAVAGIWALAWFFAAQWLKATTEDWFAAQEAQGIVAEHGGLSVQGFATRLDLNVTAPHFAGTGWDWQAPFAQVLMMAWKPWHVLAVVPGGQKLTLGGQVLRLDTSKIEASLHMAPEAGFAPREFRVEWPELTVSSDKGWTISTVRVFGAAQATGDQALKLWLQADDLTLPSGSDLGGLGPKIAYLRFDARLPLSAPLTWETPMIEAFDLRTLDISWGSLEVEGSGILTADPMGQAEGQIEFRIKGWQALPDAAIGLGLIQPGMRGGLMGALEGMSQSGEDPAELVLPLVMREGSMALGPIPLGPAPQLPWDYRQ